MKKVIVTGATGMIGASMIEQIMPSKLEILYASANRVGTDNTGLFRLKAKLKQPRTIKDYLISPPKQVFLEIDRIFLFKILISL